MPSAAAHFGSKPVTEAQLRRLYALALDCLPGPKRAALSQLNEMLRRWDLDWDAVDLNCPRSCWLTVDQYDELCGELEMIGGKL